MRPFFRRSAFLSTALLVLMGLTACGNNNISQIDRADIILVPSSVSFPQILIGETETRTVNVENEGQGELIITGYSWRGSANEFSVQGLDDLRVGPGESAPITITYAPQEAGADSATLIIESNAANDPSAELPVNSLGQASRLDASPPEVTLLSDGSGGSVSQDVVLTNIGSQDINVSELRLVANLGDIALGQSSPAVPAVLAPGDAITVPVSYEPSSGGVDFDQMLVACDADNCENGNFFVPINGIAETPRLRITPGDVAFGAVAENPSPPPTQTVNASNVGQGVLVIQSIGWAVNPADGDDEFQVVTVAGEPYDPTFTGGWEIAPGESIDIVLSYSPADALPDVENLVFRSNDETLPIQSVRVGGTLSVPRLEVFPERIEFPLTAITLTTTRELVVRNTGSEPLGIDYLLTPGRPFTDGVFGITNRDTMPSELAPGEEYTLNVTFSPTVPLESYADSIFIGTTNDPLTPEARVEVTGTSAEQPECDLRPLPATINFGTVPRGTLREQTGIVRNTGSGPCRITSVNEQTSIFGALFSDYFDLVSVDPPTPFDLGPGEEFSITASYFPTSVTDLSETFGDGASLEIRVSDPSNPGTTVTCGAVPPLFSGVTRDCGVNLQARSAVAEIAVIPGNVDFGLVTLGCNSQTQTVRVYNTGGADVDITDIRFEECTGEFSIAGVPVFPVTLSRGDSTAFQIRYTPADEGPDSCNLVIESTSEGEGRLVVPISGEGVTFSRTVDRFEQVSGREVDVLFVVDNSGSMGEEQSNLGTNFSSFITAATTWDSEFQIGVVTTQTEGDVSNPSGGSRQPGELLGSPRIITPSTPGYESVFRSTVNVGTGGTGNTDTERGLESARLALTDPNITDLAVSCGSDSDCTAPYACYEGASGGARACGGNNRTFLREDASLEVVFVSDEDDQSRAELSFYIDFLKSIKGFRNESLFHASAIVGPRGGCSSSNGDAVAGDRYIDVAEATGGEVGSICDSNFATTLSNIGNRAFGLRVQFFLSRAADASTVQVYNLASCDGSGRSAATGWTFDAASNSIIWNDASVPTPGQCFEVEYEAACF